MTDKVLDLIVKLSGFKLVVRANRLACHNTTARAVHDELLHLLERMLEDYSNILGLWCDMVRETDPDVREDIAEQLYPDWTDTDWHWFRSEAWMLGGWHRVDADSTYFNPVTDRRETLRNGEFIQQIPDNLLFGLAPILDEIVDEIGIPIVAEMVFYTTRHPLPQDHAGDEENDIPF